MVASSYPLWSIGFAAGVRKGSRETYKELFAKFKSGSTVQVAFGALDDPATDGSIDRESSQCCMPSAAPATPPTAVEIVDLVEESGKGQMQTPYCRAIL